MSLSVLARPSASLASALIRPLRSNVKSPVIIVKRMSGHGMEIKPSSFLWHKLKDMWHFYFVISFGFYGCIALYANIFIGPSELAEIPEGYRPKHWEYYRHPISRFLQRYCYTDPQQEYEKLLAVMWEEHLYYCLNVIDKKVKSLIKERKDYQAYIMRPVTSAFARYGLEQAKATERYAGEVDDGV